MTTATRGLQVGATSRFVAEVADEVEGGAGHVLWPAGADALARAAVAQGLTNRQSADRLFISPVTARNHVSRILAKLGLENRTQAAAWLARGLRDS